MRTISRMPGDRPDSETVAEGLRGAPEAGLRDPALDRLLAWLDDALAGEAGAPLPDPREAASRHARQRLSEGVDAAGLVNEYAALRERLARDPAIDRDQLNRALDAALAAAMRTAGEEQRALFDAAPSAVALIDSSMVLLASNDAFRRLSGVPAPRTLAEAFPELAVRLEPILTGVLVTGVPVAALPVATGDPAPSFEADAYPVRGEDGAFSGVGLVLRDVSHRRRREEEREHVFAELGAALEQMPLGVLVADARSGEVVKANRRAEELLATPALVGRSLGDGPLAGHASRLGTPLDPAQTPLARALRDGETTLAYEVEHADPLGNRRVLAVHAAPVRDGAGRLVAAVETLQDITDRAEAEFRLGFLTDLTASLATALDARAVLESLGNAVVPLLADWALLEELRPGGQLGCLGAISSDRPLAQAYEEAAGAEASPPLMARALESGQPELVTDLDGEALAALTESPERAAILRRLGPTSALVVPLVSPRGPLVGVMLLLATGARRFGSPDLAFAIEVGTRVALALDNARLYRQSQEAVRARDEILSVAAHDLRSPLASLGLQLDTVLRKSRSYAETGLPVAWTEPRLRAMRRQIERMGGLLEDLLDVSRIQAGRMKVEVEDLDFAALVRDVVGRLEEVLENAGCDLTLMADVPVPGRWDRLRLEQVVTNLVSNAAKYGHGKPIEVSVAREGGEAVLVVRDHGVGIAPENHERIFRRFERVGDQHAYQGLGLGLWIVARIVDSVGGSIRVQSEPGRGAAFVVRIPLAWAESEPG